MKGKITYSRSELEKMAKKGLVEFLSLKTVYFDFQQNCEFYGKKLYNKVVGNKKIHEFRIEYCNLISKQHPHFQTKILMSIFQFLFFNLVGFCLFVVITTFWWCKEYSYISFITILKLIREIWRWFHKTDFTVGMKFFFWLKKFRPWSIRV